MDEKTKDLFRDIHSFLTDLALGLTDTDGNENDRIRNIQSRIFDLFVYDMDKENR